MLEDINPEINSFFFFAKNYNITVGHCLIDVNRDQNNNNKKTQSLPFDFPLKTHDWIIVAIFELVYANCVRNQPVINQYVL